MPIVTTQELAEAAGVHRSRISQWVAEGLPKIGRGKFDAEACLEWIANRRDDAPPVETDQEKKKNLTELRARLYRLQGDGQHLRNEALRANMYLADTVDHAFQSLFAMVVEQLEIWINQGRTSEEQDERRKLAYALRDRLAGHIADSRQDLRRGRDIAVTRLRHAKRVG